ncbi:hypothetical protein TNCV_4599442 [Trichonephila clavipes]|nr:hypothetical protein TNCV_4599442 [Trichonephila clavipes]
MMELEGKDIAVIGAGVVGLSTALSLQEGFPLAYVTIFADKFNDETLSSGSGGIFRPDINVHDDTERVRFGRRKNSKSKGSITTNTC